MKRLPVLLFVTATLLASCGHEEPFERLPAQKVLERAMLSAHHLRSVWLDVSASFEGKLPAEAVGTLSARGVLQNWGKSSQLQVQIDATLGNKWNRQHIDLLGEIMSIGDGSLYVKIDALDVEPVRDVPLTLIRTLFGTWIFFPQSTDGVAMMDVTPDPQLLRTQSHVIRIEKEYGMKRIDERLAYHFAVSVDKERLRGLLLQSGQEFDEGAIDALDAVGEIWIDAHSFHIRKVQWEIGPLKLPKGRLLGGQLHVDFSRHNHAPDLSVPQDALPLSLDILLQSGPGLEDALEDQLTLPSLQ